jgi:ribosomal protein S6
MTEYEILFLVGESKKAELEAVKKSVEDAVVASGGEILPGEFVDERRMEYAISGERRGVYTAKRFRVPDEADRDVPGAVTKTLSLNKGVLRFLIVHAKGLPTLEESQERVKRTADSRRKPMGRYSANRQRPMASSPVAAQESAPTKPALSDTEIDKKLGEVLDI